MLDRKALQALGCWTGYRLERVEWPEGEGRTLSLNLKPISKAMYCEQCGSRCQQVHEAVVRRVRDLPTFEYRVVLPVPRRRVWCERCGGPRLEKLAWLGRYQRVMERFAKACEKLLQAASVQAVAAFYDLGWHTVESIDKMRLRARVADPHALDGSVPMQLDAIHFTLNNERLGGKFLKMRNINLDDLHIFCSVVREGGVARAADRLSRVPSNVTTRMKQLEDRLGVDLFRRQGRGLVLTESGRILLRHAERLLQMAEVAEQEVRTGAVRGTLKLGSLESTAGARLPPLLSTFHLQFPEMSIELQPGITDVLLRMLDRHEIDAAFVAEPFEQGRLASLPVYDEELTLISAKGAPKIRSAQDLSGQTIVVFPHGCSYRRRLTEWLAEEGVSPGKILEFGSYHAIVACVAAATGIGIISAELLDRAVLGTEVQRHPLPGKLRINRTHLVWSGDITPPLQALMTLLPKLRSRKPPLA